MTDEQRKDLDSFLETFQSKKLNDLFTDEHKEFADTSSFIARQLAHQLLHKSGLDTKSEEGEK
jgi:hypothetical protein